MAKIRKVFYDIEVFRDKSYVGVYHDLSGEYIYEQMSLLHFTSTFVKINDKPDIIYVGFNNIKYDNVVLRLHDEYPEFDPYELSSLVIQGKDSPFNDLLNKLNTFYSFGDKSSYPRYLGRSANAGYMTISSYENRTTGNVKLKFTCQRLNNTSMWFDMMENLVIPARGSLKFSALKYCQYIWEDLDIESEEYNKADLIATEMLFHKFGAKYVHDYYAIHKTLVKELKFAVNDKFNTRFISNHYLTSAIARNLKEDSKFSYYRLQELIKRSSSDYKNNLLNMLEKNIIEPYHLKNLSITPNVGGLHSSLNNNIFVTEPEKNRFVYNIDFASYYPFIYINLGLFNEENTQKLYSIYEERKKVKHTDKVKSLSIKILLNSIFGLLKFRENYLKEQNLYSTAVTTIGQLIMIELIESLSDDIIDLVDINTDGVILVSNKKIDITSFTPSFLDQKFDVDTLLLDKFYNKTANNYIKEYNGKKDISGSWVATSKTTNTDTLPMYEDIIRGLYDDPLVSIPDAVLTLIGKYMTEGEEYEHFEYHYIPEDYQNSSLKFCTPTITNVNNRHILSKTKDHYTDSFKHEVVSYIKSSWLNAFQNNCFFRTEGKKNLSTEDYIFDTLDNCIQEITPSAACLSSVKIDISKAGIVIIDIDNQDESLLNKVLTSIKGDSHIIQKSEHGYHIFLEPHNLLSLQNYDKVEYFMNVKVYKQLDIINKDKVPVKIRGFLRVYDRDLDMNVIGLQNLVNKYPTNFTYRNHRKEVLEDEDIEFLSKILATKKITVIVNGDVRENEPLSTFFIIKNKQLFHNPDFFIHSKQPDVPIVIYKNDGLYNVICYVCGGQLSKKDNAKKKLPAGVPEGKATYLHMLRNALNEDLLLKRL